MTTSVRTPGSRPRSSGSERRPPAAPTRYERTPRFRGPAWLDGPMTSAHLVFGAAGLLLTIGLVMVFSASSIEAALADEPAWAPGVQQLIWAALGVGAMLVALRLPTGFLRRWSPIALIAVAAMLLLVLVPFIGVKLNGARQWFNLGFANLQPSEVGKLVFALWGAHVLALRERYLTTQSLLVPVLPVFGVLALLVLAEKDFGGVVTLVLVLFGLLWAGGDEHAEQAQAHAAGPEQPEQVELEGDHPAEVLLRQHQQGQHAEDRQHRHEQRPRGQVALAQRQHVRAPEREDQLGQLRRLELLPADADPLPGPVAHLADARDQHEQQQEDDADQGDGHPAADEPCRQPQRDEQGDDAHDRQDDLLHADRPRGPAVQGRLHRRGREDHHQPGGQQQTRGTEDEVAAGHGTVEPGRTGPAAR